ncbi:helix-turn-helix domain-containing protein [Streptomyces chattanoogensis]|uniref:helix-turn-helix domain-containing protein n=1 Tax=Streptomyces chattanoogensis TaxID=66876 RepID=UPI0036C734FC
MRAQIVLHAARGRSHARIARETGLHLDTVRKWRGRFAEDGVPGLADRSRSGRPPSFTAPQAAQVKALACQLPLRPGRRCPAGRARSWPMRPWPGASPRPCRPPPCAADWTMMRSSPGSTAPGSSSPTPASASR